MRVAMLFVVAAFTIVWAILSIRQNTMIVPDAKLITLIGTVIGGKVAQSFSENFSPPTKSMDSELRTADSHQ